MLNVNLIQVRVDLGPSIIGTAEIVPRGSPQASPSPADLTIPWQDPHQKAPAFSLLNWHARLSSFSGRASEMKRLEEWATSDQAVSVKFITGQGGVGKSRLAAEFATSLAARGWAAGFVDLRKPFAFRLKQEGTLLIVDYPEENLRGVGDLLRDLAGLGLGARFRVLFLTRRTIDDWQETINDANAAVLVDPAPLVVPPLRGAGAYALFCTAQENAAELMGTVPLPVPEDALVDWLALAPENDRALFIVATAVHSALHPEDPIVQYSGREVIESLVERELSRLNRTAKNAGFRDRHALARLLAVAAIAGTVPVSRLAALVGGGVLGPCDARRTELTEKLQQVGVMTATFVEAPKPDIIAAAVCLSVLAREPETAPEIVWLALQGDIAGSL